MIVTIHQPHLQPSMGYFNKAFHSDVFVWLHSVQYEKNYFQNRAKIKAPDGAVPWLTLPVHAKLSMAIDEVTLADDRWRKRVYRTLEQCYSKSPYFNECWPPLKDALDAGGERLDDVNQRSFEALLKLIGLDHVRLVRAEELNAPSSDPTQRLVEMCSDLGAAAYIAGGGGRKYLQTEKFQEAGIEVIFQSFDPSQTVYPQRGKEFVPGLSIVDCLFNVGPQQTRELIKNAWTPSG